MPRTTRGYPFESKVLNYARSLSSRLAGREGRRSFLMVLDGNASVRMLQFECPEDTWRQITERLDRAGDAYLFYDPFDAPEHTWVSWRRIDRLTMERLIGDRFADADFLKEDATTGAPGLKPPNTYPATWGVMF